MATIEEFMTSPELGVRASRAAPVIVASDGEPQSDAALAIGRLFAGSDEALRIVTVMKAPPIVSDAQLSLTADLDAARRAEARRKVADQIRRRGGREGCDIELHEGDPARQIARLAHETAATMIVAGLGRHRVADRIFGEETVLRLIRLSDVPVYATANGTDRAPRRIVAAIDFSETGLRAARMSLDVAAPGATIYLTHVAPSSAPVDDWNGALSYRHAVERALQKIWEQLHIPRDMVVRKVVLQGDPATELLAFATSVNADLIATGSHGRGLVARLLIGSVASRIIRCSTCSVLTVPLGAAMTKTRVAVEPVVVTTLLHTGWQRDLDDFSRRNPGRRSTLEIDDPAIGAQLQESDCPFLGVTYDQHDRAVDLIFGERGGDGRHVVHAIGGVTGIDVWRDDAGRDLGMRIVHGLGQTILTFA